MPVLLLVDLCYIKNDHKTGNMNTIKIKVIIIISNNNTNVP